MATTGAGNRLHRFRKLSVLLLEQLKRELAVPSVLQIDIKDTKS